jgi:hypothetical protein
MVLRTREAQTNEMLTEAPASFLLDEPAKVMRRHPHVSCDGLESQRGIRMRLFDEREGHSHAKTARACGVLTRLELSHMCPPGTWLCRLVTRIFESRTRKPERGDSQPRQVPLAILFSSVDSPTWLPASAVI